MATRTRRGRSGSILRPAGAPVQVIGHRGAAGHAPENTMASFAKGLELGADLIELDVQLSRDGHLVVMHDQRVDRTTNGSGLIVDLTLAELRVLDAGAWCGPQYAGERIPMLDEVLDWARGRTRLLIEIKNGPVYYPGIVERLAEALRRQGMVEQVIVISFDHPSVRQIKALLPGLATGVLFAARPVDPVGLARAANASVVMPNWSYVLPEDAAAIHRAGLDLAVWTVNRPDEIECVLGLAVDAVGSDYPDRLRRAIGGGAGTGQRT